jgi:type I restriction enzyme, S subunit
MVKITETSYECKLCECKSEQISHHKSHLKTEKHKIKRENWKLKLEKLGPEEMMKQFKNDNTDIEKFLIAHENIKTVIEKEQEYESPTREWENISSSDALREAIHEIHNYLRNNGAGYGMNALKVFNMFYGLKRIEDTGNFDKTGLDEKCKFSYLYNIAKNNDKNHKANEDLVSIIRRDVMKSIYDNKKMKSFLFYNLPELKPDIYSELIKKINSLSGIEESSGEQLSGKIYEYFIGRDKSAISELGAYFTNRQIVNFIYSQLNIELEEDGSVPEMVDMFGGSGGFTISYVSYFKNKYENIDWEKNINKIHHYDMNEDVVKSAALEFFCLTGYFPNENFSYKNSFANEFNDKKFKYIITNPPYGGDKNNKTSHQEKRDKVKKYIEEKLKEDFFDEDIVENIKNQLSLIKKDEKSDKKRIELQKVSLKTSSKRINDFAKKYNLNANDKESISFIQLMEMLDKGGTACGVLKEGVFFDGKYKDIRRVLVENYNLKKVISIDQKQFENTSTKTSIIIFENNGPTEKVNFYDLIFDKVEEDDFDIIDDKVILTSNEGDIIDVYASLVSTATKKEILENDIFSLNPKDYSKETIIPGDGYELIKLGDICEYQNGYAFKTQDYKNIGIPLITITHIKNGKILLNNNNYIKENDKYKKFEIKENDIIISLTGKKPNLCSIAINNNNNDKKYLNQRCALIRNLKNINNYYFICIFNSFIINYINKNIGNGTNQDNISLSYILNIFIPIPKTKEKIKEWTDKISIPYKQKNDSDEKIKELEKRVSERILEINEKEECDEVELGDICKINPETLKNNQLKQISYIDISSVKEEKINNIQILTKNFPSRAKRLINKNDILFSSVRPNLKGYTLINNHIENGIASTGFVVIRCNKINPKYIYTLLKDDKIIDYLMLNSTGTKYPTVNSNIFEKIKLKIPKDKKLIENLKPIFDEIEKLQNINRIATNNFNNLIEELGKESIKS